MSNSTTVSFKLQPEYYAIVKAMAAGEHTSVSAFLRELVVEVLELEYQSERLVAVFAKNED